MVNRNNRIYPQEKTWARHCTSDSLFMESIRARKVCGHIEHPVNGKADLKEAAIIITDLDLRRNGEVWVTFETLSNKLGRHVASLIEDRVTIGMSSRARGSVLRTNEGIDEVQDDFTPETFDIVAENSTIGAEVPGVHESAGLLCESLMSRSIDQIKEEETAAICEAQLMALKDQCLKENWDSKWEARLNDIKFQMSTLNESRKELEMWSSLVDEAIQTKQKFRKAIGENKMRPRMRRLIEQAEDFAASAQVAADQSVAAAEVLAQDGGQPLAVQQAAVAATKAKIAAAEASAAVEVAKEAETEEEAQAAAEQAEYAAEKAQVAAAQAVSVSSVPSGLPTSVVPNGIGEGRYRRAVGKRPKRFCFRVTEAEEGELENDVPVEAAPSVVPMSPTTATTSVAITVQVDVPLEAISDDIRKKINIFRVGEDLSNLQTLVQGELEARGIILTGISLGWSGQLVRIVVSTSADRTPEEVTSAINGVLVVPVAVPVVAPASEIIVPGEEMPVAEESFSRRLAREQVTRDLKQQLSERKYEIEKLRIDNKNLRVLNNEMARLFEEKIICFETEAIIRKNPELNSFRSMMNKSKTITELHEASKVLKKALVKKSVSPVNPVRKGRNESIRTQGNAPVLYEEVAVTDAASSAKISKVVNETVISRLSAHRRRHQ